MTSKAVRESLWVEDNKTCHYCPRVLNLAEVTVDHIVPRAFGGPSARWNMVASCQPCNERLADRVGKCSCRKCRRAKNRFHVAKDRRPIQRARREPNDPRPRSQAELVELLRLRLENMRNWRHALEDHDTLDAAALGGKIRAYTEVLDLIDGIDSVQWTDALVKVVETYVGPDGFVKARQLYKEAKNR